MSRVMKSSHTVIGWTANTERATGKWRKIDRLSSYPAQSHARPLIGFTADGPEATSVFYLTDNAALELAKGLLQELLARPITLAADDELPGIIAQVNAAVATEKDNARQVVDAIQR